MSCCATYNRECYYQGDGLDYVVSFKDSAGDLIDLTGYTFVYALEQNGVELDSTLSDNLSVIGTGLLRIVISDTDMAVFEVGNIQHQLQVTAPGGAPVTRFGGKIPVKTSII